jgi:hypothetical protein
MRGPRTSTGHPSWTNELVLSHNYLRARGCVLAVPRPATIKNDRSDGPVVPIAALLISSFAPANSSFSPCTRNNWPHHPRSFFSLAGLDAHNHKVAALLCSLRLALEWIAYVMRFALGKGRASPRAASPLPSPDIHAAQATPTTASREGSQAGLLILPAGFDTWARCQRSLAARSAPHDRDKRAEATSCGLVSDALPLLEFPLWKTGLKPSATC